MASYTISHLTAQEQLALLKSRGMGVTDEGKALSYLARIGYYRLSGYWYPFQQSEHSSNNPAIILDTFRPGTEFSHAVALYVFDKRLRLLLLDALERIEVALRVDIAHLLGARDPWAHMNPDQLHGDFAKKLNHYGITKHAKWLERLNKSVDESSDEFVKNFKQKYTDPLPIWVVIELWDFGCLSYFLSGLKINDRQAIADKYGIPRWELLTSWVRSMNHVRNICAHHSRLWNRVLTDQPKPPKKHEIPLLEHLVGNTHAQSRLYSVVAIMQYLLEVVNPSSSWGERLTAHMQDFPDVPGLGVQQAGFSEGWEGLELWG